MRGRVDDSGGGWKMPGPARWWSPHNTQTDESEAEQLQSIMSAGRDGEGVPPRVPVWRYQHPTWSDTHRPKPTAHFPSHIGNFPLCCYGNTGFVVFSLPFTWADVSKHILVKCIGADSPLQRVDGSLHSQQPADKKAFAHMMENRRTCRYAQLLWLTKA